MRKKTICIATLLLLSASTLVYCADLYISQKKYQFKYEVVESQQAPAYVVQQKKYRNPLVVGFKINPDGSIAALNQPADDINVQPVDPLNTVQATVEERGSYPAPTASEEPTILDDKKPVTATISESVVPQKNTPNETSERQSVPQDDNPKIQILTINFELGSSQIRPEYKNILNRVTTIYSKREFEVVGFTCPLGSKKRNERVALERATAVADFISANGGKVTKVMGKPMCCYVSKTENWKNRRVEIYLKSKGGAGKKY